MEVGVGLSGFADPKEQVECSMCHKTAIYGDVMRSWWEPTKAFSRAAIASKKLWGLKTGNVYELKLRLCGGPPVKNHQVCEYCRSKPLPSAFIAAT